MKERVRGLIIALSLFCSGVLVGGMTKDSDNMDKIQEVQTTLETVSNDCLSDEEKRIFDLYNDIIANVFAGRFSNNQENFNNACDLLKEYYDGHFLYSAGEEAGFYGGQVSAVKEISKLENRPYVGILSIEDEKSVINYYPMEELSVIMTEEHNYVIYGFDGSDVVKAGSVDLSTKTEVSENITDFVVVSIKDYLLTFEDELSEEEQLMLETEASCGLILINNDLFNKQEEKGFEIEKPKEPNNSVVSAVSKVYVK